jgi:hypothetical protein
MTPSPATVKESPALTFASHRVLVPVTVGLLFVTLDSPVEYCDIINPYRLAAHMGLLII